jgi:hypothetical protein
MNKKKLHKLDYVERIREILSTARHQSLKAVNATMVAAYWYIGKEIVEEEQKGKKRAAYGEAVIETLATNLQKEFGKGFSKAHLKSVRQFYVVYFSREPAIRYTPSGQSDSKINNTPQSLELI